MCGTDGIENTTDPHYHFDISRYLIVIANIYKPYHGCIAIVLVILGSIFCIINVISFNRPTMQSPTNFILSGIACADLVTMFVYLPYVVYFSIVNPCALFTGLPNALSVYFLFWYIITMSVSTCISIWLAVYLAALRYTSISMVRVPSAVAWRRTRIVTAVIVLVSMCTAIPHLITTEIVSLDNGTVYTIQQNNRLAVCSQAVIVKLLPPILLSFICIGIVKRLRTFVVSRHSLGKDGSSLYYTTLMIIIVVVLVILLESPQAVILAISMADDNFFNEIYNTMGDFVDLMTLFRTIANFMIYCVMNQEHRDRLRSLISFCIPCLLQYRSVPTTSIHLEKTDHLIDSNNQIEAIDISERV